MATEIKINKNLSIKISLDTQTSTLGRPFRLSGVRKNAQLPEKWIDRVSKNHWVYSFIYLDAIGGFFEIETNYYDGFVRLNKML